MAKETFSGSCLCGAVRYEAEGEAGNFFHCHCSRCRKSSGTGHASNVFVSTDELKFSGDTDQIRQFKVPDARFFERSFCATCGGPLPKFVAAGGFALIPAGTLDSDNDIHPTARIYQASRTRWSCEDTLPAYDEFPKD